MYSPSREISLEGMGGGGRIFLVAGSLRDGWLKLYFDHVYNSGTADLWIRSRDLLATENDM